MTARLAVHPDIADRAAHVLTLLRNAGVDVDFVGEVDRTAPFDALGEHQIDLGLVGITALRGAAAGDVTTVAVLPRMETRDVLVSLVGRSTPLSEIDAGARIGFAGERRAAFLAAHRNDVLGVRMTSDEVREIAERAHRSELDADADDAIQALVMSALDARHAGLLDATVEALDPKSWLPEPGQGALALVARHPIAEATALDHLPTRTALRTELALLDALEAEDVSTLGCLAQPSGRWIRLWAAAASSRGDRFVRSDRTGPLDEPEALGAAVADELVARGYPMLAAARAS